MTITKNNVRELFKQHFGSLMHFEKVMTGAAKVRDTKVPGTYSQCYMNNLLTNLYGSNWCIRETRKLPSWL